MTLSRLTGSTKSALPTVANQSAAIQLQNSARQMENAVRELKGAISKAHTVCGSLEIEASADLINSLESELEEFRCSNVILKDIKAVSKRVGLYLQSVTFL